MSLTANQTLHQYLSLCNARHCVWFKKLPSEDSSHTPDNLNLHHHCCQNLLSCNLLITSLSYFLY